MTTPDIDWQHNAAARTNRLVKATRLADALADRPFPATAEERRDVERVAGIRRASDETWSMAIEIAAERAL